MGQPPDFFPKLFSLLASRSFAILLLLFSILALFVFDAYLSRYFYLFFILPIFVFLSVLTCSVGRILRKEWGKGRVFYGSMIFHAGMLTLIMLVSVGAIARTHITAYLPQGVTVNVKDEHFISSQSGFAARPDMFLRLDDVEDKYENDKYAVDRAAMFNVVTFKDGVTLNRDLVARVNLPAKAFGYKFILFAGEYSPRFVVNADGNNLLDSHVRVSNQSQTEDSLLVDKGRLTLLLRFFPDVFEENGRYGSKTEIVRNPAFGVRVLSSESPFKPIWTGVLKLGEKTAFGKYTIEFAALKPVSTIIVVKDGSFPGIFIGWVMIFVGLALRYVDVRAVRQFLRWTRNSEGAIK